MCTQTVFQDWVLPDALWLQHPLTSNLCNSAGMDSGGPFICSARWWQCAKAGTKPASGGGDYNGNYETCFLIMSVLVVNVWRCMGRLGALVRGRTFTSLAEFYFHCQFRVLRSGTMLFRLTTLGQETWTGCCSVTLRCCFPGALFLGISRQRWHQSPFVLVFAFWFIPMAWSFWHAFPYQIDFSGSPTYTAVWSQAMSPGCKRGYISQKYFLLNIFNGFMDWNMCSCIFYTKNM